MTLDELMEGTVEMTQAPIIESKRDAVPLTMIYADADGEVSMMLMPYAPHGNQRSLAVHVVRDMLHRHKATAYVFVIEAWTYTSTDAEEMEKAAREGLSQHPGRRETLAYIGCDKSRGLKREYDIKREGGVPEVGPIVGFERRALDEGEETFDRNTAIEGWMVGLLW